MEQAEDTGRSGWGVAKASPAPCPSSLASQAGVEREAMLWEHPRVLSLAPALAIYGAAKRLGSPSPQWGKKWKWGLPHEVADTPMPSPGAVWAEPAGRVLPYRAEGWGLGVGFSP